MSQLTLFDFAANMARAQQKDNPYTSLESPYAHKDDPQTSFDAAEKMVKSGKLANQEMKVYIAIKDCLASMTFNTFTAKNIALWSGIGYYTIHRRLSGLHRKGKIKRTGEKRDNCCVWKLVHRS